MKNNFSFTFKNKTKLAVGLMSGTSLDGIDAVVTHITGSGTATKLQTLAFETYPYPKEIKNFILKNSHPATAKLDDVCRLNFFLAELFADAVKKVVAKSGRKLSEIDFIGSHGQTIQHLSEPKQMFGKNIRATLQIGDPAALAKLTGVLTVGDFRVGDIALGGTGAPLVPYVDYCLFRSEKMSRALLNIGGIANITLLPKLCGMSDVLAFDTGAGNMVIDALMKKYYKKEYDTNGKTAAQGTIHFDLLNTMLSHPYFKKPFPKSTGREEFGETFVQRILNEQRRLRLTNADVVATATMLTVWGVYHHLATFRSKKYFPVEIIVSGGGAHNETMMKYLKGILCSTTITPIDAIGVAGDAKEAIAFAILANETLSGNCSNVPSVTGASRATVLGKICLP